MFAELIKKITAWASINSNIASILLVGSHARGEARPDSDVDLVLICKRQEELLVDISWINQFGIVDEYFVEQWGKVQSARVFYQSDSGSVNSEPRLEVEFGITGLEWVELPLDAGTANVVAGGFKILLDKTGTLQTLK